MEKKYEQNPEKAKYIKQKLFEKYGENFEKHGMSVNSDLEICNLAEFLILEHPEKYAKSMGTENNYRNDEDLQKIYAVVSKEKNVAVLINTNENGKVPEGEFGVYDLQKHTFEASKEMKEKLKKSIREMANDTLTEKEIDEMTEKIAPKNLDDMDKIATLGEKHINEKARKAIDAKIDEKNLENGKTKDERNALESKTNGKEEQQAGEANKNEIPADVAKTCKRLGITNIKAFMYAKGAEFASKTDIPYVNKNGGNVLIIRTKDTGKSTDKYFVFQDGRLCVPGNRDEEIDQVARKSTQNSKNGTLIKPLDIDDEEQYVEYQDSQGLVIREKLEENMNLSTEDLEGYKKQIQKELESYSEELYKIEETAFLNDAQKDELYIQANERFNTNNEKMARQFNIDLSDVQAINLATDERTQEQVDKEEDEFDERGKPLH